MAYDAATGARLWTRRYDGVGGVALGVSPDGTQVFVTGSIGPHYATAAYDATTGAELWTRRYKDAENVDGEIAVALGVSADGTEVFVTGWGSGSATTREDIETVAYGAATGTRLWKTAYDSARSDEVFALGVSPDGSRVFVTGVTTRWARPDDYLTVAYRAT
jgi:hypothetical protein